MLRLLPVDGMRALVALLHRIENKRRWPLHVLCILIALLDKAAGGTRPIAPIAMIVRVWCRCRNWRGQKWLASCVAGFDDAVAGRSAEMAVYDRAVANESAASLGFDVVTAYLDGHKFYDNINLVMLAGEAAASGYSPMVLCMLLRLYAAVRVIRVQGACASGFVACTGVLPGCQEATNMAKSIVRSIIGMCLESRPLATIRKYLDDLTMPMEGTEKMLIKYFPQAACDLIIRMQEAGLPMSPKPAIVATKRASANAVADNIKG